MSLLNKPILLVDALKQAHHFVAQYKPSKQVCRYEIKIEPVDMLAWLSLQTNDVKIYGANQTDTVSIAGIGQAVCLTDWRIGNYKKVFKNLRFLLCKEQQNLQWYGGFCFDERHRDANWEEFGAYRFVIPRFELAAQHDKMIFACNLVGRENIKSILKQLDNIRIPSAFIQKPIFNEMLRREDEPNKTSWQNNVQKVLLNQNLKKVVLARKTALNFKRMLDPWGMLRQLKAVTANSYHFAFQFKKTVFLGASPERLFRRLGNSIETEALAGTLPESMNPKNLLNSSKNRYEHELVVEGIKTALAECCQSFTYDKVPSILNLPNGHHLISKFNGQLKEGMQDEDILALLHPTPALGGVPRNLALDMIREFETFSRGWYGAPLGYVGVDGAEFVVGIRSGFVYDKRLSVFAGAGIVSGSEPDLEWDEIENKISNFIKIIQ